MPEPLTIAVAVVGLLRATYSTSTLLAAFVKGVQKAPKTLHDALNETRAITSILQQLQCYLDGAAVAPRTRSCLITLEEIVATLTDCVGTISELETILRGLQPEGMTAFDRLRWRWHNDAVVKIVQRIERHKTSLSIMLSIMTW
jgi:hypothetical protein